jgi:hypothetical protein
MRKKTNIAEIKKITVYVTPIGPGPEKGKDLGSDHGLHHKR